MKKENQIDIFCEDDQHFHKGEQIKYLMVKQDKGSIKKRLFCDECFLGKYSSYQQYCCDVQELINGNIYESFKNTKFDSNCKQEYFNYAKNHFPYLKKEFIQNMITRVREEITSIIDDLEQDLLEQSAIYCENIKNWTSSETLHEYFNCDELRRKLLDIEFERSPLKFEELNISAEAYVKKINTQGEKEQKIFQIDGIIEKQKKFFNLERFDNNFNELLKTIQTMRERTFSEYTFSQSSLATPYIKNIIQRIAQTPEQEEKFHKALNRIYRFTKAGSNYKTLQQIDQLKNKDTLTIIQTKNKCIFGVYNCYAQSEKSFLFQMNKEKIFPLKRNKQPFQLNQQTDLSTWIMNFGEGDILINSTFTQCSSNFGNGFDIDGTEIWNRQEYLSDSLFFDIYDMEIFEFKTQDQPQAPPFVVIQPGPPIVVPQPGPPTGVPAAGHPNGGFTPLGFTPIQGLPQMRPTTVNPNTVNPNTNPANQANPRFTVYNPNQ
ncbi:unnamed protein product [Paramecium sonneborni]|uniref:TLDc domain-containing protein n=1 Tax=Paramecium sonneborni TaxID=65129 RepID=A0A8S1K271_9CILI|nr:unnamed protein product [Paramecium sonneborni]